jgi:TetR/AcrR family transcriptional repressor of uid operon
VARKRDEVAFEGRRAEILSVAEALFAEHGFHQTGMAAICDGAGMSPGALYRYFRSKSDLIQGIVERERRALLESVGRLEGTGDLVGALVELLVEGIRESAEADYARLALEIAAEARRNPDVGAVLERAEVEVTRQLAGHLAAAKRAGVVGTGADPDVAARLLVAVLDGSVGARGSLAELPPKRLRAALRRLVVGLLDLPPP